MGCIMNKSRTQSLFRNTSVGLFAFVVQLIITFVSRVVFIRSLGIEYLGINDLYTNIISLLCLADMGIETVFMYSLYKPISESNYAAINSMIGVIKRFYHIIAIVILIIGLILIPFLPFIIGKSNLDNTKLIIYYLFFLSNCVLSYLLIYRSALLQADQNVHIVKGIKAISQLIFGIIQIILITIFKSYCSYLIAMILGTLFNNITLNYIARKKYNYLSDYSAINDNSDFKSELSKNTKSVFVYKIGTTIINSTDNIFISAILGASMVGFYSNYHTIILAITSIIGILNSSLVPGVGNYLASVKDSRSRSILFNTLIMIYFILATIFSGSFVLCSNKIITIWVGGDYVLNDVSVLAITVSFYFQCIAHPIWIFRETAGLFDAVRPAIISMAIMNVLFSLVGGIFWGIAGIIGATTLSRLLSLFWYEPKLLNKSLFESSHNNYWGKWFKYFSTSFITMFLLYIVLNKEMNTLLGLIIKVLITAVVTIILFYITNRNSDEFTFLHSKTKNYLRKGKNTNSIGE